MYTLVYLYTNPIGPHNGGLLYTRLEGAEDGTEGVKVGGNANDGVLKGELEFNGGPPAFLFKLLTFYKIKN